MTITCPSCGAASRAEDRFCESCGANLAPGAEEPRHSTFCTSCGAPVDEEDRFCGTCGAPVRSRETVSAGGDEATDDDDLLADWDLEVPDEPPDEPEAAERGEPEEPHRHEAVTESIPRPARPSDTAVIQRQPEAPPMPPVSTPPPRPAREPRAPAQGFPTGATFALLGAVAVIVSAILEWGGPFRAGLPRDIAVRLLFDSQGPATGPNLGVVLLGAGTLGALVALLTMAVPLLKPVRRLIGLLTLAMPAGFAVRTFQLAVEDGRLLDLPSLLGPGFFVALVGAFVEMVAGKWFRR